MKTTFNDSLRYTSTYGRNKTEKSMNEATDSISKTRNEEEQIEKTEALLTEHKNI